MKSDSRESVLESLKKMIEHERSSREVGNVQEAEAFAARIQRLLTEHKLDMTEVEWEAREAGEPIDWSFVRPSDVGFHGKRQRVGWQIYLANGIAEANTCEAVMSKGNSMYFVGRTTDRGVCATMFLYLLKIAKELAEKDALASMNDQREEFIEAKGYYDARRFLAWMQDYRKAWYQGFVFAIVQRLETETKKVQEEKNNELAMIHIAKDRELIKVEVATKSSEGTFSNKVARSESGFMDGIIAAAGVDLNVGKNAVPQKTKLLGACA